MLSSIRIETAQKQPRPLLRKHGTQVSTLVSTSCPSRVSYSYLKAQILLLERQLLDALKAIASFGILPLQQKGRRQR